MRRHLEQEIREKLNLYLSGQISLTEFRSWFVPRVWALETKDQESTEGIVNQVFLALAEYSNDDWSEDELRALLQPLTKVPSTF